MGERKERKQKTKKRESMIRQLKSLVGGESAVECISHCH